MATRLRIGINGFGRIGRAIARQLIADDRHDLVAINDLNGDRANLAYLLNYDSLHRRMPTPAYVDDQYLIAGRHRILCCDQARVADAGWPALDVLVEASGTASNAQDARGVQARLRIVTHAAEGMDATMVFGVNEAACRAGQPGIVSTSICDAVACAPVLRSITESFGLVDGFITTLHPWLAYQNLLDGRPVAVEAPGATFGQYVLGRSAVDSLIPKPSSVATACERVLPVLEGRLQCFSYRVPTSQVTSAELLLVLERAAQPEDVLHCLRERHRLTTGTSLFEFCGDPLVSIDFAGNRHSAVVDTRWLVRGRANTVRLVLWYDNEWGYAAKVVDAIDYLAGGG